MNLKSIIFTILIFYSPLLHSSTYYENDKKIIDKVYLKLMRVIGDQTPHKPKLKVGKFSVRIASFAPPNNIIIEKNAINICRQFDENMEDALSFLIGHELAHYYLEHFTGDYGFTSFLTNDTIFEDRKNEEYAADVYGAFISYQAGYNTLEIIPTLLEALYSDYGLKDNPLDYPPLSKRKAVVIEALKKTNELINAYEIANLLVVARKYDQAQVCYQFISQFLNFKELSNNQGILALSMALHKIKKRESQFDFPLILDLNFRSRQANNFLRNELLNIAESSFKKALNYDIKYFPSALGLASVYILQEKFLDAKKQLAKTELLAETEIEKSNFLILKGIYYSVQNESKKASDFFKQAIKISHNKIIRIKANNNLKIINGQSAPLEINEIAYKGIVDRIEGVSLRNVARHSYQHQVRLKSHRDYSIVLSYDTMSHSRIARVESTDEIVLFQRTSSKHFSTKRGVKQGEGVSVVLNKYGKGNLQTHSSRDGYFLVYLPNGLIFQIDQFEKLKEWIIFSVM